MSATAESEFLDALDEWLAFKKNEAKGIDGPYVGWLYGHQEFNDLHAEDRAAIASHLSESLRALITKSFEAEPQ